MIVIVLALSFSSPCDGVSIFQYFNNINVTDGQSFNNALQLFAEDVTATGKRVYFVSLGCSTMDPEIEGTDARGKHRDPFIMYKLSPSFSGVFVEASPFVFSQMVQNVRRLRQDGGAGAAFVNGAVGCDDNISNITFYSASAEYARTCKDCPPWVKYEKGSVDINALNWKIPRKHIVADVVPCLDINDILRMHKKRSHFLFVDVEGVEYKTYSKIKAENRPVVMVFEDKEHRHAPRGHNCRSQGSYHYYYLECFEDAAKEAKWLKDNDYFTVRYDHENVAAILMQHQ